MGQKINSNAFRLNLKKNFLSNWIISKKYYNKLLEEDFFIRNRIENYFNSILTISKITINRSTSEKNSQLIFITIHCLSLRTKEISEILKKKLNFNIKNNITEKNTEKNIKNNNNEDIISFKEYLIKLIKNLILNFKLNNNNNYFINLKFIDDIFEDPMFIAKFLAKQLNKRIPFRRALNETLENIDLQSIKGIKIQISGRLDGEEMARTEWKLLGQLPLHTLNSNINYINYPIKLHFGILGIKIWLCIN